MSAKPKTNTPGNFTFLAELSDEARAVREEELMLTKCGRCGAHRLGTLLEGRDWHAGHVCGSEPRRRAPLPPATSQRRERIHIERSLPAEQLVRMRSVVVVA